MINRLPPLKRLPDGKYQWFQYVSFSCRNLSGLWPLTCEQRYNLLIINEKIHICQIMSTCPNLNTLFSWKNGHSSALIIKKWYFCAFVSSRHNIKPQLRTSQSVLLFSSFLGAVTTFFAFRGRVFPWVPRHILPFFVLRSPFPIIPPSQRFIWVAGTSRRGVIARPCVRANT